MGFSFSGFCWQDWDTTVNLSHEEKIMMSCKNKNKNKRRHGKLNRSSTFKELFCCSQSHLEGIVHFLGFFNMSVLVYIFIVPSQFVDDETYFWYLQSFWWPASFTVLQQHLEVYSIKKIHFSISTKTTLRYSRLYSDITPPEGVCVCVCITGLFFKKWCFLFWVETTHATWVRLCWREKVLEQY